MTTNGATARRRTGRHPLARVGGPPEDREYIANPCLKHKGVLMSGDAYISAFATVDSGVKRETVIGPKVFIMQHAHVGHDSIIGEGVELATGCVVGGYCEIGDNARIGINATILPYRRVGEGAVVGAGAVIVDDVPRGAVMVGNPARELAAKNPVPHSDRKPPHPDSVPTLPQSIFNMEKQKP